MKNFVTEAELARMEQNGQLLPVNQTPTINPGAPPTPQTQPSLLSGTLPPQLQTPTDLINTQYGPTVPTYRLQPVGASGLGGVNAAVQSQVQPVIESVTVVQGTATAAKNTANTALQVAQSNTFQGAWNIAVQYFINNQVSFGGSYYVAIDDNIGAQPDISPSDWQLVGSAQTSEFIGAWSSVTAYEIANQVTYAGNYYIALQANTNKQPDLNPADWQQISTSETFLGTYSGSTAYVPGNQVVYNGNYWICISATTGNAPSTTSSFWTLVGTSAILIGSWNSPTAYVAGNEVTFQPSGGAVNYYVALQANTNKQPDTNPSDWYLIANNTSIASASSYRPTTNPLTAHDAGSNVTITIANFTMSVAGIGNLGVTGGTITGLAYSTVFYVFYSDPMIAGGSVTFQDSTTKTNSISSGVNFYVGSILTPAQGASDTIGNNDGGTGGQSGGTVVVWPSTATGSISNPTNAINNYATPSTPASGIGATIAISGFSGMILPACQGYSLVVDWADPGGSSTGATINVTNPTITHTEGAAFSRKQTVLSLGQQINPALTTVNINDTSGGGTLAVYGVYIVEAF